MTFRPSPRLFVLGAALVSAAARAWGAPPTVLKEIRFWSSTDVTRIAIELSEDVEFKQGRIESPVRIFVDLVDVKPSPGFKGIAYTVPVEDGLVKQIRVAPNQARITRVVLDMETDGEVTASKLVNPSRIVLDVRKRAPVSAPTAPGPAPETTPQPSPAAVSSTKPAVPEKAPGAQEGPAGSALSAKVSAGKLSGGSPSLPPASKPVASTPSAKPAEPPRLADPTWTRVLGLKLNRVVLDPGHGGHDQGTESRGGLLEKDLVLDVAVRLGRLLEERLGTEVIYTRKDDTFVALESRPELANKSKADLFLSIHANSSPARSVSGVETYYLHLTNSREDLAVATRENAGAEKSIHELGDLVNKIVAFDKRDESREFAARIQNAAHELSVQANGRMRNRGVKRAPFVVLIGTKMPSVLAEIGFISNPKEEALFRKPEHRQKVAEALYKGIVQYARSLSHFSMARRDGDD